MALVALAGDTEGTSCKVSPGTKEEALDFMFAEKVISRLEGRFEDYILQGLLDLKALIAKTYGEGSFKETNHRIARLMKEL